MEVTLDNGDKINVNRIVDIIKKKTVKAHTKERGSVDLWKDDAYDAKGDFTRVDVENRLKELFN